MCKCMGYSILLHYMYTMCTGKPRVIKTSPLLTFLRFESLSYFLVFTHKISTRLSLPCCAMWYWELRPDFYLAPIFQPPTTFPSTSQPTVSRAHQSVVYISLHMWERTCVVCLSVADMFDLTSSPPIPTFSCK